MQVMKWSVMALAIAAATSHMAYAEEETLSSQAASNGFIEDADLTLLNRNFAFYRNHNHGGQQSKGDQNYHNEWAHGFMTTFTSGFTQGTVGFGVDAFGNVGLKLNSGSDIGGTDLLPIDGSHSKKGQDAYGIAGGAVKARISETVLTFGQQQPQSPVFATGDARLLPSYATGTSIVSDEIADLHIQGGHFYSGNGRASTNQDGELTSTYGGTAFNAANYIGGDYAISKNLSVGLHASEYEDLWHQYYADLYHTYNFSDDVSLRSSLNYYKTRDTGDSNGGEISNNAYSAAFALTVGAQTFTLAHQRVNGNTPLDYLHIEGADGNSIFLANSVQYSDFNAPGEKSYQARYDLDMTTLGVPGLSFMARYLTGSGSDGTDAEFGGAYNNAGGSLFGRDGEEWERDLEVKYVIQEGAAKDLSFRVRQASWRSNNSYYSGGESFATGLDEVRIITEYPLDIL